MKDTYIQEQLDLLKSSLEQANFLLSNLYEKGMFIVIAFDERGKTMSPTLEVKTAIQRIDYLKE